MTNKGTLRRISPDELDEILTKVQQEEHRELVLLGPRAYLDPSPEFWPDELKGRSIFQLTDYVDRFAERLLDLNQLQLLILLGNKIDDSGVRAITENLNGLTSLDLSGNNIGDAGARAIADKLNGLTTFNLSGNNIGEAGAKAIADNLNGLTSLNLSGNNIGEAGVKAIAEKLNGLTTLVLSGNNIGDAGARAIARHLIKLSSLNLAANTIGDEGAKTIARHLWGLSSFSLGSNQISEMGAKAIAENLIGLSSLDLYINQIGDSGAKAIARNLSGISSLDLGSNKIGDQGAKAIAGHLFGFILLNLSSNQIGDEGAKAIGQNLIRLNKLHLQNNFQLTSIADFSYLTMLSSLSIARTRITDLSSLKGHIESGIPVKWDDAWFEHGIHVQDCPLVHPTPEVISQGHEAVLNYFREIEAQGMDRLFEAKVLILGEGGAGKTSLLRRLYYPGQPLPDEDETTRGIDVFQQEFKTSENRTFRLNVWDFGGQQIYHATHQFFLTKSSLYVLVDDTRKDHTSIHDEGFKYWLEVVEALSDRSPLLIFQNEKGGRSKKIDEAGIKGRFPNVLETYRGDLEKADSTDQLRKAIEFHTQELPHIGDEVPAKWVTIRAAIKQEAGEHPYISQERYFEIYREHLEFDKTKALHLSQYLHDLGVFLHFQNDLALGKTVILQNRWATEAVFKILDDEKVKSQLGHFTVEDCRRLWASSDYADMHSELLALMAKFELCYLLSDTSEDTWLAPQLLSPSKPKELDDWADPDDLVLCYKYTFLPKGLISRLMVRMHRFVKQPDMAWTSGALFQHEQTQILVEMTDRGDEIILRARGSEKKALMSVIASDLDTLNASFRGLEDKIGKLIPCICKTCICATSPEFFEQKRLLQRKRDNKLTIECPTSYIDVGILELLDGLKFDQLPTWATEPKNKKRIIIFLASSAELREDRDEFDLYFRQQNDGLSKKGLYLEIVRWENVLDAMSKTRLQDEYNKKVRDCDIFVSLFKTKTGKFTEEEFDVAIETFKKTGKPLIYTFFKEAKVSTTDNIEDDLKSLWSFRKKLKKLGHFVTEYKSTEDLKLQFKDQLEKLRDKDKL